MKNRYVKSKSLSLPSNSSLKLVFLVSALAVVATVTAFVTIDTSATTTGLKTTSGPTAGGTAVEFDGKVASTYPSTAYQFMADGVGGFGLGLTKSGQLKAWGDNFNGELGDGTTSKPSGDYRASVGDVNMSGVLAGKTIVQATTSYGTAMVLTSDNKLYAWGGNYCKEVNGTTQGEYPLPTAIDMTGNLAGKTIAYISSANNAFYAVSSDG